MLAVEVTRPLSLRGPCEDRWMTRRRRGAGDVARGPAVAAALAVTTAVLALQGCGIVQDDGAARRERDDKKRERVLGDPHPRPSDVIDIAGAPSGIARSGDGSLLLTYEAEPVEDDEGPAASAWRLHAPDGRTVADGARHRDAEGTAERYIGVPDGFVRVPPGEGGEGGSLLDTRGKRHRITTSGTALGTRPGDVLLSESEPALLYRPATEVLAPVAHVPREAHRLALDEKGTAWSVDQPLSPDPNRVVWQRDGRTRGTAAVPEPCTADAVAARGGTAAVSLLRGESEAVRGLLVTPDGGAHWHTVTGGGVPWGHLKGGSESFTLEALSDGRLLVGEEGGRHWLADDRTGRAFHPLDTPVPFTRLTVQGATLHGIAEAREGAWVSRDAGSTWQHRPE